MLELISSGLQMGGITSPAGHMQHHSYLATTPTPPLSGKRRAQTSAYLLYTQVSNPDPIHLSCPGPASDGQTESGSGRSACSSAVACQGRLQCSCPRSRFWQMQFCAVPSERGEFPVWSPNSRGNQVQRLRILHRQVCATSGSLVHW